MTLSDEIWNIKINVDKENIFSEGSERYNCVEKYANDETIRKENGIKNDPNDWAIEHGNPRYILDLLLLVIAVSIKTVESVKMLTKTEV
jgi:predicted helicase